MLKKLLYKFKESFLENHPLIKKFDIGVFIENKIVSEETGEQIGIEDINNYYAFILPDGFLRYKEGAGTSYERVTGCSNTYRADFPFRITATAFEKNEYDYMLSVLIAVENMRIDTSDLKGINNVKIRPFSSSFNYDYTYKKEPYDKVFLNGIFSSDVRGKYGMVAVGVSGVMEFDFSPKTCNIEDICNEINCYRPIRIDQPDDYNNEEE